MRYIKEFFSKTKIGVVPLIFFIIGTIGLSILGYSAKKSQDDLTHSKVEMNAMIYAQRMQLDIAQGINITNTIEQIVISNNGELQKFPEIAENLMDDFIQSIQLAPNGVVTEIYPAAGNDAGKIDLIHDKDRGAISCYARDNDVVTMQGPFNLKQGGSGIAIRNPIYLENADGQEEFWGFSIAIIRVPEVFSTSIKALSNFGYDYKLYKNVSPWDDTFKEVYGSGADMTDASTYTFDLGDSHWKLMVQPQSGWNNSLSLYLIFGCGILIILLISGMIEFFMLLRKTKAGERQTAKLNKDLQEALKQAKAASSAKSRFIGSMSHDMRTPMNAIMGYTTIARNQNPEAKVSECLEKIDESSKHLLTLINDVLEISKIESGKVIINPIRTNISVAINEVLDIARGLTAGRVLNFETKQAELKNPYVLIDEIRIREIFVNILSNAIKFTKDGGTITFTADYKLKSDSEEVIAKYTIADTGIGMSDEFQKHMFEEFTQEAPDARTQYSGTGLGLAISKRNVELMGGTITVHSKKAVGTTITIEIPMKLDFAKSTEKNNVPSAKLSDFRLLLAEDNELNAEIAQTLLTENGANVTVVRDGQQALNLFKTSPIGTFDAILMDVMMPTMNGLDATRAIRALNRSDAKIIPIIAMTANAYAEDVQKCISAGMNAHLAKPLDMGKVKTTIWEQVRLSAKKYTKEK